MDFADPNPFVPPAAARRAWRLAVIALAAAIASGGCAWPTPWAAPPDGDPGAGLGDDFARSRLIAQDFVGTLVQIPALTPRRTLLATDAPRNRFGELLVAALQDAGYEVRMNSATDPGVDRLAYEIDPVVVRSADAPPTWTFLVSAGPVRLKRDYAVASAGVRPASSMFVHGADASRLTSRDELFDRVTPPVAPGSEVTDRPDPPVRRSSGDLQASARGPAPAAAANVRAVPLAPTAATPNLFETGRSRFAPLLADYDELDTSIMIFPNDSLVMGRENKRQARLIAERFDPATDVISVVGCSHGPTALANGNETLATGRSWRVKEEFMLAGIAPDRVLEEGCWAGVAHEAMPARGVVVTHRRRAG